MLRMVSEELGVESVGDIEVDKLLLAAKVKETGFSEEKFDELIL